MKVGQTSNGNNIYLDGSPFDMAEITLTQQNFTYNISNDLATGNALTMQRSANLTTPQITWSGAVHDMDTQQRNGQGNIIVARGSDSDKLFFQIFNSIDQNGQKIYFDVHYWNAGDPSISAIAQHCSFETMAPLNANGGTGNSMNTDQWTYLADIINRT